MKLNDEKPKSTAKDEQIAPQNVEQPFVTQTSRDPKTGELHTGEEKNGKGVI